MLALTIILLSIPVIDARANVGRITEQSGPTEIQRNRDVISSQVNVPVRSNDTVVTARSRTQITFDDNTRVQITEQSRLVIDSFVYDPNRSDAGRIGMRVALGTARLASGQIAKNSPQNVRVETPTATIAVRGTDFSMTVDELGRSLIILLPSCPTNWRNIERDCKTGKIDVTTDSGTVTLDQPFEATRTVARESNPAPPAILRLSFDQINNMLILTPPRRAEADDRPRTALDVNFLDRNLLAFGDLDVNFLTKDGNRLDVNFLDQDFLFNLIDLANATLLASMFDSENQMLPGFRANRAAGLRYYTEHERLTLFRTGTSSYAQVTVDKDNSSTVNIIQDQVSIQQIVNRSGGSRITVIQSR